MPIGDSLFLTTIVLVLLFISKASLVQNKSNFFKAHLRPIWVNKIKAKYHRLKTNVGNCPKCFQDPFVRPSITSKSLLYQCSKFSVGRLTSFFFISPCSLTVQTPWMIRYWKTSLCRWNQLRAMKSLVTYLLKACRTTNLVLATHWCHCLKRTQLQVALLSFFLSPSLLNKPICSHSSKSYPDPFV